MSLAPENNSGSSSLVYQYKFLN